MIFELRFRILAKRRAIPFFWLLFLVFSTPKLVGQITFETSGGVNFYFPDYKFISENGVTAGVNYKNETQIGAVLEVLAFKKINRRWSLAAGFRGWNLPTGGRFYLNSFTYLQDATPKIHFYLAVPLEIRFRLNSLFSLEMGWQSGWMLNFQNISPLLRNSINGSDFAGTLGCRYHFKKWHFGFRYSHSTGSFSQYSYRSTLLTKVDLRQRNFQIFVGFLLKHIGT